MKRLLIALLALGAANSITPAMACLGYAPGSCVWVDTTSYGSWSATPALGAPGGYGGSLTFWGTTSGYATILPSPNAGNVKLTLPATAGTLAVSPLPLTSLSPEAANTVVANASAASASPTAYSMGSCSAGGNALNWTTSTGFTCASGLAVLATPDQTQAGGANLTAYSIGSVSGGTTTLDCGKNPVQYLTNAGAFTLAAPASDGACIVQVINGASSGAITLSGFATTPTGTGDTYNTGPTAIFALNVFRINGTATAIWKEQQ